MKELLYVEVPTPDMAAVLQWLHAEFRPTVGRAIAAPTGLRWFLRDAPADVSTDISTDSSTGLSPDSSAEPGATPAPSGAGSALPELAVGVWSVQRTTYLKVFRWRDRPHPQERRAIAQLQQAIQAQFPPHYPEPPVVDLSNQSIFAALGDRYPLTVQYFQQMPNGEYDLNRVYWWERRWRESVRRPQQPRQVVFTAGASADADSDPSRDAAPQFDLIYIGGALGVVHAAVMARLGYRVLLLERMPFGRMNREWNISRQEFQSLIDLGLFTPEEFEDIIAAEYRDGFHKFFDANNPPQARAEVLHTPTVLNIAIQADHFIQRCGAKLREAGGEIWDETEFERVDIGRDRATIAAVHLPTRSPRTVTGRLVVDAMGTASPIAWQINGGRPFDSVCPTVGAVIADGFDPAVWDHHYGDVLFSHGDISRGRQLIWELFPAGGNAVTVYLFHYHQIHPDNPGSLLEMYEDFFTILPEYRRCDLDALTWEKATFGYIPGYFSTTGGDRRVAFDRLVAIGDAASLQSPLVFTGFGSLVRNLGRLTDLLDAALRHDLLSARHLNQIRAYQSNIAVTWMFSKGMMVPTGRVLPPQRVNSMLNTFFGLLATEDYEVADTFIKDRFGWFTFNRLALKAARLNPMLLWWIWDSAGPIDLGRWLGSYLVYTLTSLLGWFLGWLPAFERRVRPWLEDRAPALWFWLLAQSYALTWGLGRPPTSPPRSPHIPRDRPTSDPVATAR